MDFGILLILIYTSLYLPGCLSGANAVPEDDACSFPVEGEQDLLSRMNAGLEETIKQSFKLDYFNFPIVDNTRLSNNHRFAIVLDELDLESSDPHMELVGIVFPSEYASLRDRTGMKEIRELLESALHNDDEE